MFSNTRARNTRVLIIGAEGFLGSKLMEVLAQEFTVVGTAQHASGNLVPLDITDAEQVRGTINRIDPAVVILAAAATDVDRCQAEPAAAATVNVQGTAHVAAQCAERKLVYLSTESVFDGQRGDYREADVPNPINEYGKTKLRGEEVVAAVPDHLIIRTCMLYGDRWDSPRFINWVIRSLTAKQHIRVATDLFGTPTLTTDVAEAMRALLKRGRNGVYHVAGATALSCYDMALTIAEIFGCDGALITPCTAADLKRRAPRPKFGTLNTEKLLAEGIRMSTFGEGIQKLKAAFAVSVGKPYRTVAQCRICHGTRLVPYLDLGHIPLVNRYIPPAAAGAPEPKFPLQICLCLDCALSQLSIVVDPEILYQQYAYRSSISETFRKHCAAFAQHAVADFGLHAGNLVVDIASNDGCLLQEFRKLGIRMLGVDPAQNLAAYAIQGGIPTVAKFWNRSTAQDIRREFGAAKCITAMNVFAHVDDLDDFLDGAQTLLAESGVLAIEVPYLVNFFHNTEFDTSYHEHLSYFLVKPLIPLFQRHGLEIFDIRQFSIHGGSIRLYVKRISDTTKPMRWEAIAQLLEGEQQLGLSDIATYRKFARDVARIKQELCARIAQLRAQGKRIAAYGASAKGTVLLNYCGIGKEQIAFIVDDTPEKEGYLAPGTHIPIVPFATLMAEKPDYLLLLAWNFASELMEKTKAYRAAGGKYLIPIPKIQEL